MSCYSSHLLCHFPRWPESHERWCPGYEWIGDQDSQWVTFDSLADQEALGCPSFRSPKSMYLEKTKQIRGTRLAINAKNGWDPGVLWGHLCWIHADTASTLHLPLIHCYSWEDNEHEFHTKRADCFQFLCSFHADRSPKKRWWTSDFFLVFLWLVIPHHVKDLCLLFGSHSNWSCVAPLVAGSCPGRLHLGLHYRHWVLYGINRISNWRNNAMDRQEKERKYRCHGYSFLWNPFSCHLANYVPVEREAKTTDLLDGHYFGKPSSLGNLVC